jgi:hypothetical protein
MHVGNWHGAGEEVAYPNEGMPEFLVQFNEIEPCNSSEAAMKLWEAVTHYNHWIWGVKEYTYIY